MLYTNEEIKKNIELELDWDNRIDTTNVKVTVAKSEVTLEGTVPNFNASYLCVVDAEQILGVTGVTNLLTVKLPHTSQDGEDEDIVNKAKKILFWNSDLRDADIYVIVEKGVLTLKGSVDTYSKKNKAEHLLIDLHGVIDQYCSA